MKIGFTGTQRGQTGRQLKEFSRFMSNPEICQFHHGDCIGADEEAHGICDGLVPRIVIHPPRVKTKRAFCRCRKSALDILLQKDYLDRNHDIVDATEMLIATPGEKEEQLRSGTWATVRYARKQNKPILIIFPDGSTKSEKPQEATLF